MWKEESIIIGLLHLYHYSNGMSTIVKMDTLDRYHKIVNENLERLNVDTSRHYFENYEESFYHVSCDENDIFYYVINENIDLKELEKRYLHTLPIKYYIASNLPNTLFILGIRDSKYYDEACEEATKRIDEINQTFSRSLKKVQ